MLETPPELAAKLGTAIRARRKSMAMTQAQAAARSGVSYGTWRRMEAAGKVSIEDLARAAVALRCEDALSNLFAPEPTRSIDELLGRQR
jgi:transcriptional regulator with XRE-family HTH domain